MEIRPLRPDEREWLAERLRQSWGSSVTVSRGVAYDALAHPALIAEVAGERAGVIVLRADEVLILEAFVRGEGIGQALMEVAVERARAAGHRRIWLITTNDNWPALRFYQRFGMRLVALRPGAIDEARRLLKPEIPTQGVDGIPIRDELELELELEL